MLFRYRGLENANLKFMNEPMAYQLLELQLVLVTFLSHEIVRGVPVIENVVEEHRWRIP